MKTEEFAEKYLGVTLNEHQKAIITLKCPKCDSTNVSYGGFFLTPKGTRAKWYCIACSHWWLI